MSNPGPLPGRSRELGLLRTLYDRPEASWGWVVGPGGVGTSTLVGRAAADFRHVHHRAPPLPELAQRAALARSLRRGGLLPPTDTTEEEPPPWERLFEGLVESADGGGAVVLVVDDAHRWAESRARFRPALLHALTRARARGRAVHVTLVAPEPGPAEGRDEDGLEAPTLRVRPLPFGAAAPFLPGDTIRERLEAYAVFGGLPATLARLDRGLSLATNVRRLALASEAPLAEAPLHTLERHFQTPTRYAAILGTLAAGEGDWGVVHAGIPDLTSSGQVAPYLKRLEELGMVEARRSLDASPRTRSRRYRIVDPWTAFWFRVLLPLRHEPAGGGIADPWALAVRPALGPLVQAVLGQVWRDFMVHDALEHLGVVARECGSLWGNGYDIPVAGVLSSGACFYGVPASADPAAAGAALASLDTQVRETRYGFGRERRLRILFLDDEPTLALQREAARRDDTLLLTPVALAGT